MKKLLFINQYYYPGWRSGGPQQSIMNFVDVFGDKCDIYILTHNHDMGEMIPYPDIEYDKWVRVGKSNVYYSSTDSYTWKFLEKMISQFDLVYLCEPYQEHSYKALILNRMGKIKVPVILAPMGCFSMGALSHKSLKKHCFWRAFLILGLYKNITWSFTSDMEKQEAAKCIGRKKVRNYFIAEDLPKAYIDFSGKKNTEKKKGALKIIFLSRICPKKNLEQAIKIVSHLNGDIQFDIYGTKEDLDYWEKCEKILESMPENIRWNYYGAVPADQVVNKYLEYDIFLFPTKGENFGHVIYESLMGGCIPLISDRTPWNNLEEQECGEAYSLDNMDEYVAAVQKYVDYDSEKMKERSDNAMNYARQKYEDSVKKSGYYHLI